jgi:predicted PurR-regulated permease PerM
VLGTLAAGITGLFLGPIVLAVVWELLVPWLREPVIGDQSSVIGGKCPP